MRFRTAIWPTGAAESRSQLVGTITSSAAGIAGPVEFVIEPHRGIGPISFGASRAEVVTAMAAIGGGLPYARNPDTDCFFKNAFQVSFGDAGSADFIELCSGIPHAVLLDGRDVFDMSADELLSLVRRHEPEDAALSQPPHSYLFSGLILTLWDSDEQYDYKGGERRPVFGAVGIGAPSYLAAIRAIHRV